MLNYRKIIVVGCSGGGKTTFAKQLADITGLPLVHLDNIYWQPDGTHLARPAFIRRQKKIMNTDAWIIDGNYRGTVQYRIKRCELAFFFDMPTEVCLQGVLTRDPNRADIACVLEPNEELLEDIRTYAQTARPRLLELFRLHPNVKVITFTEHQAADAYLEELRREYGLNV